MKENDDLVNRVLQLRKQHEEAQKHEASQRDVIQPSIDAKPALKLHFGAAALAPQPMGTIVKGLLHSSSLTLIYGPPKSGKSFWLTSLFIAIAAGDPDWMGHKIKASGPVLYVACEGHAGFWKRLVAAQTKRGSFPDQFILATGRPMLIQLTGRTAIAVPHPDDILAALAACQLRDLTPIAVAVDTVFRSFGGGNVNQSDHMNAYIAAVTAVMDCNIGIALVHHETKAGGTPAGSVTLIGAADTIIATRNGEGNVHTWQVEAAKDDAETAPRNFTLDVVDIGTDGDGDVLASCVMTDQGANETPKPRGRPKKTAERDRAFDMLCDVLSDHGKPNGNCGIPATVPTVVHIDHWRDAFKRLCRPGNKPDTKLKAFNACVKDLQNDRRIGVLDDWVWPVHTHGT